jgi:hypothetical protein
MLHDIKFGLKLKKGQSHTRVTENTRTWLENKLAIKEKKKYRLLAYCYIITVSNINKSEKMVQTYTYGLLHGDLLSAPVLALITVWTVQNIAKLYISLHITLCQGYTGYWFWGNFRHICVFTTSSGSRFVCFITLSTSLSHLISGLPLLFLPSVDQVIILMAICYLPRVINEYIHTILTCYL